MTISAVLILYGITSLGFIVYLFLRKEALQMPLRILFISCTAFHLLFVLTLWYQNGLLPMESPAQAVNMLVLFSSLAFIPIALRKNTAVLAAFFLPIASFALGSIAPLVQPGVDLLSGSYQYWYPLHTLSVIAGEALFVVASTTSVVYLIHERIIRKGSIHSAMSALPPLTLLDSILYASLALGFFAITVGMILGGLWASAIGLSFHSIAPKVLAGALMWLVFGLSLHQRFAIGWKGRRTAIITLIGFVVMVLLFIGINLAFPESHGIRLI
jgi:ABC-type transport system involved in cytochrome c biogenesis permease subunit